MNRILTNASLALALVTAGLSLSTAGCANKCNGNTCSSTSTTQYTGTAMTVQAAWSPGQDLVIDLPSASVRVGDASTAITVVQGTGPQMNVTFTPFTSETAADKQKAIDEMNQNLHLSALNDGSGVKVIASTSGTHGNALSAFVDIVLPANFNGRILATPGNGSVSIQGAAAGVVVETSLGDVAVSFAGPVKPSDTGHITAEQGDVTFDLVASSDISFQAFGGNMGAVLVPSPLPAGWTASADNTPTAASFIANGGSAVPWKVDASKFFTSKVAIKAH